MYGLGGWGNLYFLMFPRLSTIAERTLWSMFRRSWRVWDDSRTILIKTLWDNLGRPGKLRKPMVIKIIQGSQWLVNGCCDQFLDDLEWCGCGSIPATFDGLGGWENLWKWMNFYDSKDWWANLVSILERSWRVWSDSRTRLERPYTSWEAEKTYRNKDIPTIWSDWWTNIVMDSKRSWRA